MGATSTHPGSPSKEDHEEELGMNFYKKHATHFDWNYCKSCKNVKPPHTHHCRVCNRCVLYMDHHCPWVSNCVGLRNYRYFILFMFWVILGLLFLFTFYVDPVWINPIPRRQLNKEQRELKRNITLA